MAGTVAGFYAAYATFHPSDGIPDAKGRAKYAPFVSPSLEKLLADGARAEEAFAKANKGSPPLLEGDLFTSNFEGATSYRLGACDATLKTCKVDLTYDDRSQNPKDKAVTWTDTVHLAATQDGWRVDDIGYGATWAFGNKGLMRDTLASVIRNASE
ncbi:MAG: hypothetical protein JOZ72_15850 [Alphaproteobacteria bacterium]|nr:hypothetical protein [Alphaproteobacteria bacterium]